MIYKVGSVKHNQGVQSFFLNLATVVEITNQISYVYIWVLIGISLFDLSLELNGV